MQDNLLSIGKMAEMNHLTVAALRLYDEMNLLKPRLIDPTSGYRYYDISQNARLDMIAYMKELGMSLAEIQDVLEKEDIAQIETILVKKNEQLYEEMRLLRAKHHAVERAITSIERYRKSPTKGTISLEYIERRYYWGQKCKINFYEKNLDAYEEVLLSLRKKLIDVGFSQIHSYNIGTSIDKEDYLQMKLIPKETFIFADYRDKERFSDVKILDSGMFACIYLDEYNDEPVYAEKLLSFCHERGWQIDGDYICEVLTEFNVFDSEKRNMFMRLQVPVKF